MQKRVGSRWCPWVPSWTIWASTVDGVGSCWGKWVSSRAWRVPCRGWPIAGAGDAREAIEGQDFAGKNMEKSWWYEGIFLESTLNSWNDQESWWYISESWDKIAKYLQICFWQWWIYSPIMAIHVFKWWFAGEWNGLQYWSWFWGKWHTPSEIPV